MKGFVRSNDLFSLCGLNCALCPMKIGHHCGGCGNGNQSCRIAKCSLENGQVEYCFECSQYPCEKYHNIDEYDSFITHKNQIKDLHKAAAGMDQYILELQEKLQILEYLLNHCNNGRRKNFFCIAVNLLELSDLQEAMTQIRILEKTDLPLEKKSSLTAGILQKIAGSQNISLRLIKKHKS